MFLVTIPRLCSFSKQIVRMNYQKRSLTVVPALFKSKGKKVDKKLESDPDDEIEQELDEEILDKTTKVINVKVNSLRTDVLLKMGVGMARNKIENLFYESKIRVNGKKILKKGEVVEAGDEIDIIKGVSVDNPKLLVVARVEVLSVDEKGEKISARLRRTKSLIIENYNIDPWKGNTSSL
ncbi:hypothetical protein QE152_g30712 [Popillia japonica]|uniref:Mitochondrial transcription rescue factor 1 C-terminal domain-containing protein n=1 Tax=Popillia japonica TaxID=7064 RepID=A0AAW1JDH7_POPJA